MKRSMPPVNRLAHARGLGWLLCWCCLSSCDNPFPPSTQVDRLRILGIKADPPETDPWGTVQLTALVADPKGLGRDIQYRFAACAAVISYEATDILCPGADGFDLQSDGQNATLVLPDFIAWLLDRGIPINTMDLADGQNEVDTVQMLVGLFVQAGEEKTRALKRVTVRLLGEVERNRNPGLLGLSFDGQEMTEIPTPMPVGTAAKLKPLIAPDSRQTYRRSGEDFDRLEDHLFSWYSTAGDFLDKRTILDVDPQGRPLDEDEFTVPSNPGLIQVWVVVRDGRSGEDWLTQLIEVTPK